MEDNDNVDVPLQTPPQHNKELVANPNILKFSQSTEP